MPHKGYCSGRIKLVQFRKRSGQPSTCREYVQVQYRSKCPSTPFHFYCKIMAKQLGVQDCIISHSRHSNDEMHDARSAENLMKCTVAQYDTSSVSLHLISGVRCRVIDIPCESLMKSKCYHYAGFNNAQQPIYQWPLHLVCIHPNKSYASLSPKLPSVVASLLFLLSRIIPIIQVNSLRLHLQRYKARQQ